MGAAAAPVAAAASIAGLGLKAAGDVYAGKAKKQEFEFKASQEEMQAARAERAAQFGKLNADLTDVTFREELNKTLGNIDVMRAAAHADPSSPSTAAVESFESMKSDRQRTAALVSINAQVKEDEASAAYLHQASAFALSQGSNAESMGWLNAGADILGGLGKMGMAGTTGGG